MDFISIKLFKNVNVDKNETINKLHFTKIKHFCSSKDTTKEIKRQATDGKKIFANYVSNKGLVSIIQRTLKCNKKQLNS